MHRRVLNPHDTFDSLQYGFSQAVVVEGGRRIHLSGQVDTDENERTVATDLGDQMRGALANAERVLRSAGASLDHVTMLRIYIAERAGEQLAEVATVLKDRFPHEPPASSWVLVSGLAREDWLVEVEAEAVV